jgi:sec-independent protein translocase protein TatA
MGNLGAPEIILIILVILVFFGAKKIPEIAQGIGKGIREFRKASRDVQDEFEREIKGSPDGSSRSAGTLPAKTSCFYCHTPVAEGARFCPSCGKSLESPKCAKCGSSNVLGNKYCSACGEVLPA